MLVKGPFRFMLYYDVFKAFLFCNVYVIMAVKSPFSFMLRYCGGGFCCDVYLMMGSAILSCCGGDLRMLRL